MRRIKTTWMILAAAAVCTVSAVAETGRMEAADRPLLTFDSPGGWSLGGLLQFDAREFKTGADPMEIDGTRFMLQLGANVLPFLQLRGEAGTFRAEREGAKGERGLAWGIGAEANLAEYIIRESPVAGRKEYFGFSVMAEYRSMESNFEDDDFSWSETRITPLFRYVQNRAANDIWRPYDPTGLALRAGLVYQTADGEFGDADLEQNRDFGGLLGFDLRWQSGWMTRLQAVMFGSQEHEFSLGIHRHF